jgi:osmotically inducible lipoprotein OsmB
MRQMIVIAFMAAALLAPTAAGAGERLFDGALGAASGALVAGPAGFLAGGAIGYVAGPRISRGLGFHRHYRYRYARYSRY